MSTSRYTVRRVGWFQPPHGDPYTRRLPGATPLAHFDNFDDAEGHRRELEVGARDGENPFRFGGASMFFQSSLDGPRLHDWLMDEGIDPPVSTPTHADWRAWWDAFAHTWNEHQLAHAWSAFDKVRFFDVVENEPDPAFVVVEIVWGRLERDWYARAAGSEGGRLVGVYRGAVAAEAERARNEQASRAGGGRYCYDRRFGYGGATNQAMPARLATFHEALAVPSDVLPMAGLGYLVQRRAVVDGFGRGVWADRPPASARVPIALFAARADANAHRDRLAVELRTILNPFVFSHASRRAATDDSREALDASRPPLPVPTGDSTVEWVEWFDLCQDEMTDDQRAVVWDVCDNPLLEVIRVEVRD